MDKDKISLVAKRLYIGGLHAARGSINAANNAKTPLLIVNLSGFYLVPAGGSEDTSQPGQVDSGTVNNDNEQTVGLVRIVNIAKIYDTPDMTAEYEKFLKTTYSNLISDIDEWYRKGYAVVVNCQAGINRSAFLIGAFLISNGVPNQKAYEMLISANRRRGLPALTNWRFRQFLSIENK